FLHNGLPVFLGRTTGTWATCRKCAELVDGKKWSDLTERAYRKFLKRHGASRHEQLAVRAQFAELPLCRSHARQGLTSRHGFTPKPGRISFRERTCSSTGPLWNRTYTDLNSVCYNSITEQGQMFWIAAARGRYGSKFDVLSMLSISLGI